MEIVNGLVTAMSRKAQILICLAILADGGRFLS